MMLCTRRVFVRATRRPANAEANRAGRTSRVADRVIHHMVQELSPSSLAGCLQVGAAAACFSKDPFPSPSASRHMVFLCRAVVDADNVPAVVTKKIGKYSLASPDAYRTDYRRGTARNFLAVPIWHRAGCAGDGVSRRRRPGQSVSPRAVGRLAKPRLGGGHPRWWRPRRLRDFNTLLFRRSVSGVTRSFDPNRRHIPRRTSAGLRVHSPGCDARAAVPRRLPLPRHRTWSISITEWLMVPRAIAAEADIGIYSHSLGPDYTRRLARWTRANTGLSHRDGLHPAAPQATAHLSEVRSATFVRRIRPSRCLPRSRAFPTARLSTTIAQSHRRIPRLHADQLPLAERQATRRHRAIDPSPIQECPAVRLFRQRSSPR